MAPPPAYSPYVEEGPSAGSQPRPASVQNSQYGEADVLGGLSGKTANLYVQDPANGASGDNGQQPGSQSGAHGDGEWGSNNPFLAQQGGSEPSGSSVRYDGVDRSNNEAWNGARASGRNAAWREEKY